MKFLQITRRLIMNLWRLRTANLVPEHQANRNEFRPQRPDPFQELLRLEVEHEMFMHNVKISEQERLKEYFDDLAKQLRRRRWDI